MMSVILKKTAYTARNIIMYWNIQQITGKVTALCMSQIYAFSILDATTMYFIFFLSDEINYHSQIMWLQRSSILLILEIVFASQLKNTVWTFSNCVSFHLRWHYSDIKIFLVSNKR